MRIALQLSGRLKYSNESLGSLLNAVINVVKPDIFCSFWITEKITTSQNYEQIIKPKLVEYEDHSIVRPYIDRLFEKKPVYPNLPAMAYKFHRVSMIRQMYERANNFSYDCIIQARSDNLFFEQLNPQRIQDAIEQNAILCTNFFQPYIDTYISPSIRDNFYLGPRHLMDLANSEFWHLLMQIEKYEERGMTHNIACTEIIQSKVWKNLNINVRPLLGTGQCGTYFQGHFAYDIDRRPSEFI